MHLDWHSSPTSSGLGIKIACVARILINNKMAISGIILFISTVATLNLLDTYAPSIRHACIPRPTGVRVYVMLLLVATMVATKVLLPLLVQAVVAYQLLQWQPTSYFCDQSMKALFKWSQANKPGPDGKMPLLAACKRGILEDVKTLLDHGASLSTEVNGGIEIVLTSITNITNKTRLQFLAFTISS